MKKFFGRLLAFVLILCASLTMFGCDDNLQDYNIIVNVWYANYGTVYGTNTYKEKSEAEIKAVPKDNYEFLAWMKNNVVVSYDAVYKFEVNKDTAGTYVAIFDCPKLELVTLKSISFEQEYTLASSIVDMNLDVSIGQTYDSQTTIISTSSIDSKDFDITEIITALNYKDSIFAVVNLSYTLTTIVDEEETETTIQTQTIIQIDLTDDDFTSQSFSLNIPESLKDETSYANIQFSFDSFKVEKEPEAEQ